MDLTPLSVRWLLSGLLLFPLLWFQGRRARRDTPRLPEAAGPASGVTGEGAPLRVALIGESPVAGVGVERYEHSLAAQLAAAVARQTGRRVEWQALGENGARVRDVRERLLPRLDRCDACVLVVGVNDTTGFTPLAAWRARLSRLIADLQNTCSGPVLVAGVPPMHQFTALPQPLRWWIGLRAAQLDAALRECAARSGATHVETPALSPDRHLARDGYHPSAAGCEAWGAFVADRLAPLLPA